MISDVLRNAKLAPIILHGRKMMGTAPALAAFPAASLQGFSVPSNLASFYSNRQQGSSATPAQKLTSLSIFEREFRVNAKHRLLLGTSGIRAASNNMIVIMEKTML